MVGIRKLAVAVATGVALALLPSTAEAEWSPPRRMESTDWHVSDVASATARDGRMVVAWRASPVQTDPEAPAPRDVLHLRRISATGQLGPTRTMSSPESGDPSYLHVAVDADGDALVTWHSRDTSTHKLQVWARRISWSGVRGPLVRVSPAGEEGAFPRAALAPKGGGVILYERNNNDMTWRMVRFSAGSRLGRAVHLGDPIPYGPRVTATPAGDFVTAARGHDEVLRAIRLRRDDTVARRKVQAGGMPTGVGSDRHGTVYLTYQRKTSGGKLAVFVRRWFSGGRMSTARRLTPRNHIVLVSSSATGWRGDTFVTWSRQLHPDKGYVDGYGRMLRRDGSLGAVRRLGPMRPIPPQTHPYLYLWTPSPAIDDAGNGVVAWASLPDPGHAMAWARRVLRDGSVGPKELLRDNALPVGTLVKPNGRARVLLREYTRLWVRSGP
jgi:hypothetical protein